MISFIIGLTILLLGYLFYSKLIARIAGEDPSATTPAVKLNDGVDFLPMPTWKVFLIQFLNIAGLGPIFGAVAGAMWGPVAFIWIAFGAVFAGAVHDYFSGMLSIKNDGLSIPEIVGRYLGVKAKYAMRAFTVVLLILVGVVFILGPAKILSGMTPDWGSTTLWVWVVFVYYFLATLLPIDKVIGRIYPVFGLALLIMAVGLITALFIKGYQIPEINFTGIVNNHSNPDKFPIFPMLFVTIACGAISGFHSTQSPLMARCLKNEKHGRPVFYGSMITEGVVALIWAAISMSFFGGIKELNSIMAENNGNAAWAVNEISNSLLGKFGGLLALLGVVAAPISSGDTAFRSARLIVSDFVNLKQKAIKNRLIIAFPLFVIGYLLTQINFGIIWRYFAWANQALATIVLWAVTVYLMKSKYKYLITLIPALFMTVVISSYLMFAPEMLSLPINISVLTGVGLAVVLLVWFMITKYSQKNES